VLPDQPAKAQPSISEASMPYPPFRPVAGASSRSTNAMSSSLRVCASE
jgi:hypothetical protein